MPAVTSLKVQERISKKFTGKNCQLLSFEKGRKVKYICSCGNEAESYTTNISKESWGGCALNARTNAEVI